MKGLLFIGGVCLVMGLSIGMFFSKAQRSDTVQLPTSLPPIEAQATQTDETDLDASFSHLNDTISAKYSDISTIAQVMQLRSDFDQTEALYTLAGRSNSKHLQQLIRQAFDIADATDRRGALTILFMRLVDLDPHAAVSLIGEPALTGYDAIESSIWRSWSRLDFDSALAAADLLTPQSRKVRAAQAMYFAFGIYNGDETRKIEQVLGIAPSRWAKNNYALDIADSSPSDAMTFLNTVRPANHQSYIAGRLGLYMGQKYASAANDYAPLINSLQARDRYVKSALDALAAVNPQLVLERWQSRSIGQGQVSSVRKAFSQLVENDLEQALAFWGQLEDKSLKQQLSKSIVANMAESDHYAALEWASAQQSQGLNRMLATAVSELAKNAPIETLDALYSLPNNKERQSLIAFTIGELAKLNPQSAIDRIRDLSDISDRRAANTFLISSWVEYETESALAYAIEHQGEIDKNMLNQLASAVSLLDPKRAMEYLALMQPDVARAWSAGISQKLIQQYSFAEIETLLQQNKQNKVLRSSLATWYSYREPEKALSLAIAMDDGIERDQTLSNIIDNVVHKDPRRAADVLANISDRDTRSRSIMTLSYMWQQNDSDATREWIATLSNTEDRDTAIGALELHSSSNAAQNLRLLNSVSNPQAKRAYLFNKLLALAVDQPSSAKQLIKEVDLDERDMSQLNETIERCSGSYASEEAKRQACRLPVHY